MKNPKPESGKPFNCGCPAETGPDFWDAKYQQNALGWDLATVSPPLKAYIDQVPERNLRILIPGCGNSYEADYLQEKGFTNITLIDVAPTLVQKLKQKYTGNSAIRIIQGDFFEHEGQYDLILEQTFFCALDPVLRPAYVKKMHDLLAPGGKLAGVLFDREFEEKGPPFGGNRAEYKALFEGPFTIKNFSACHNSVPPRQNTELFITLVKR